MSMFKCAKIFAARNLEVSWTVWLTIGIASMLASCTSKIDIPSGNYAVISRMGEVVGVVGGPSLVEKTRFVESVSIFQKEQKLVFTTEKGITLSMKLEVIDPKKFWITTAGRGDNLVLSYKDKLINLPPDQAAAVLIAELNKPENGCSIKLVDMGSAVRAN